MAHKLAGATPTIAAQNYLSMYERRPDPYHTFDQPKPRKEPIAYGRPA